MAWALEVAPWAQACVGEGGCVGLGAAPGRAELISGVLLALGGAVSSGLEHAELSCRLAAGVPPLGIAGLSLLCTGLLVCRGVGGPDSSGGAGQAA